jgi:hypothetical protein
MVTIETAKLLAPLVLGVALSAGGCTSESQRPAGVRAAAVAEKPAAAECPVIVRLVGRHFAVTASSGPDGVVYSASGRDGAVIVANASLDELRQQHPEIYQQIIPGIAEKRDEPVSTDTADDAHPVPVSDRHVRNRIGRGERLMLADVE